MLVHVVGQNISTRTYRGYEIRKTVARVAYARNGNHGNPSVTYNWYVPKGGDSATLGRAKRLIDDLIESGEFT